MEENCFPDKNSEGAKWLSEFLDEALVSITRKGPFLPLLKPLVLSMILVSFIFTSPGVMESSIQKYKMKK